MLRTTCCFFLVATVMTTPAAAQRTTASPSDATPTDRLNARLPADVPPAPIPPAVITRDAAGHATVRAVRLEAPLSMDGRLDEAIYASVPAMSDFVQMEPRQGAPATEKTEVWLFFDDRNVYVAARCWESDPERMIVNEMRRDNSNVYQNENFSFLLDTFYDRRNGVALIINPLGGLWDAQVTNERDWNGDYNIVADIKTGRFEGGWTLEVAVPFKSLRYRPGQAQMWGLLARRVDRWKNEISLLTPVPAQRGGMAIAQASLAATVVGLEVPPKGANIEIKPYVLSSVTSDLRATPASRTKPDGNAGLDVKYAVTQNVALDVTVNTDFAQVEADEQQVNLTRFSAFFPEKREFFLENRGIFAFGGTEGNLGAVGDAPLAFYSRRIGLAGGRLVPVRAGGRLTGRMGRFTLGAMNLQTGVESLSQAPATNFSVLRIRRDFLRRSTVGAIFTERTAGDQGPGSHETYGADGAFVFLNGNLTMNSYLAKTSTPGLSSHDVSYRTQAEYNTDRYGAQYERLVVEPNFNPAIGFVRRPDMAKHYGQLRFSPRPHSAKLIRKFRYAAELTRIADTGGRLMSRSAVASLGIDLQNSDVLSLAYERAYEFLPAPFRIAPSVTLPQGGYDFGNVRMGYNFGQQRHVAGSVSLQHGTFYNGDKTTIGISGARMVFGAHFSAEPSYQVNAVDVRQGSFTTHLTGARVTYMRTPRMFVSALLQYNTSTSTTAANVRLRWEYQPGSELFVVYNDERDTMSRGFPDLINRTFVVKINKLFRL